MNRLFRNLGRKRRRLKHSVNSFRFAETLYQLLSTITLPLKTPGDKEPIVVELDVVKANVPALLGLDAMDTNSLIPCILTNTLVKCVIENCKTVS